MKSETVKMIENENLKVTLTDVATAGNYILIEYDVDLKNNQADRYSDYINGLEYYLERVVKLDGKIMSPNYADTQQMAYKITDNEIKIYDIIETEKIEDDYKIEVEMYDTDLMFNEISDENSENDSINLESEESLNSEDYETEEMLDLEETESDETWNLENSESEETEDNYEEVSIDSEEYFKNQENADNEESEELVTPYYDVSIQDMDENKTEDYDNRIIGTLRVKLKKSDTDQKAKIKTHNENEAQDDITTKVNKIIETDTAKFIIVDTEQKNVTEETLENAMRTPENFEINVQDENGNTIKTCKKTTVKIYNEKGQEWYGNGGESETELGTGTAEIQTIIGLVGDNKSLKKIKLQQLFYQCITSDSDENLNNKKWYEIKDGTYTNQNQYDGTVNISKIKIENDLIKFYFEQEGLIPSMESVIMVKNKEDGNENYIVPERIYQSEEGKYIAEFRIEQEKYEDTLIPNVENAEFAIFENENLEKVGQEIILGI